MRIRSIVSLSPHAALLSLCLACQAVPAGFGATKAEAHKNSDALFESLVQRFTNVTRAPRYERARELIGRHALTPSVIFNDTTIWTSRATDGTRTLFADASFTDGRYIFSNAPSAEPLNELADGRHTMRLRHLKGDDYEWLTNVDFAIGTVSANDIGNMVSQWLASAEGRTGSTLRAEYRKVFPKTTAALGKLIKIDTLISVQDKLGGNTVYIEMRITPNDIRAALPKYAAFLDKYALRTKFRLTLTDKSGAKWYDMIGREGRITLKIRSKDGHFAPLDGEIRPIPETLTIRFDLTAKVKVFTVGVNKLVGQWVNIQTPHERGWEMQFTKEPEWQLPPVVGSLIRSPLKRPFEGAGSQFRIAVRDNANQQTLLTRRATTTVQESGVLRFLGKLGGDAMGDFVAEAEAEENRFNATLFNALRADIAGLLR